MQEYSFNREKFKRLVHYVIHLVGDRPGFGATKLNKVLWFVEARGAVLRKKPVTGARFTRQQYGPVPAAVMPTREALVHDGAIRITKDQHYDRPTTVFKSLRQPDVSDFDHDEIQDIRYWVDHIDKEHTATSISEATHDYGWKIAAVGDDLPYFAVLSDRVRPLSDTEMDWATRRARELNLL